MFDDSNVSIDSYFQRKFSFEKEEDWLLPSIDSMYQDDVWSLENLNKMKSELNEAKSLLNDKGEIWHEHTSNINKAGFVLKCLKKIINPEILTQAWCKFYEILKNYSIISADNTNFISVHLCEAPGGFISALNNYLHQHHPDASWEWTANTLNPYYEGHSIKKAVVDDRLLFPTVKNWYFGKGDTGDITDPEYINDLILFLEKKGPVSLVTADGSFDCLNNPAEQELLTSELQFSEMLIAVNCLCPGGNFVFKQFTSFECITICKMYFLNCLFQKVHVFKPFTSKAGNSEVYIICMGYLGNQTFKNHLLQLLIKYGSIHEKALFPRSSIPESFLLQISACSNYFASLQNDAIKENLELFSVGFSSYEEKLNSVKQLCAEYYLMKYGIESDGDYFFARLFAPKKQIKPSFYCKQNRNCKSMYFQAVGETFENLSKSKQMIWKENVLDVEKRLNACFPVNLKRSLENLECCFVWKDIPNRMKSKHYGNWFSMGKRVDTIRNSKFCNPLLMHLWNQISHDTEIQWENHASKTLCYYDISSILLLLKLDYIEKYHIRYISEFKSCDVDDPLWSIFKEKFCNSSIHNMQDETEDKNISSENQIFYINTTYWIKSLHQESIIKNRLSAVLCSIIKVMDKGDLIIICIQSLLMRYTAGLFFIILSLFEKFFCLLPTSTAPANCGQLWIFQNFQKPEWLNRVVNYFETLPKIDLPESKEVLQIIPISALCSGSYYEFLLDINNNHMLQRLRNLTSFEKNKIK